ncbi:MAG: alanine racemase [Myxococcales bacterium]|nr:alanine racemase [Myxococcales bacterium]
MTPSRSSPARRVELARRFRRALADEPRPCALVDLDAFDRNVRLFLDVAQGANRPLRVATKSVRSPELLRRIASAAPAGRVTFMTYTAAETAFLHGQGLRGFLLAYPVIERGDARSLADLAASGAELAVVVDDHAQLEVLDAAATERTTTLSVVLELDVAYRPLGSALHLGVRRSPLRGEHDALSFAERIGTYSGLRFGGLMGYEAQIAGLPDDPPGGRLDGLARRALKARSRADVEATRARVVRALEAAGRPPRIVNGGGTGNLAWCAEESTLTELTVGSGFLCSHLFDRYRGVRPEPAAFFALRVVRRAAPGIYTCAGGGYVASGPAAADRLPSPWFPEGLTLAPLEGVGEVQTPLLVPSTQHVAIGDTVFFRHAKAGELAEHFAEYLLVRGEHLEGRARTYRGHGQVFLG